MASGVMSNRASPLNTALRLALASTMALSSWMIRVRLPSAPPVGVVAELLDPANVVGRCHIGGHQAGIDQLIGTANWVVGGRVFVSGHVGVPF